MRDADFRQDLHPSMQLNGSTPNSAGPAIRFSWASLLANHSLPAPRVGRAPSKIMRSDSFSPWSDCRLPAFWQNLPAFPKNAGRDRFEPDCVRHHAVSPVSDHRDFARKAHVSAGHLTGDFCYLASARWIKPNSGLCLWPKKFCSWRRDTSKCLRREP